MKSFNLKGMSFEDLIALRDNAERIIRQRASSEKKSLEDKLARISGFVGRFISGRSHSLKGRKVAAKYRNPENPSETWAGRGARPRWLQAYLKDGRNIDDFAIGANASARAKPGPKKGSTRKPRRKKAAAA